MKMYRYIKHIGFRLLDKITTENTGATSFSKLYQQNNLVPQRRFCDVNSTSRPDSGDGDQEKKLKILQLEADVMRQEGRQVPSAEYMQDYHWEHLLSLPSRSARTKYLTFLFKSEKKKENEALKKIKRREEMEQRKAEEKLMNEQNDHIIYGINHTSMFLRIYDTTINLWNNNKLIQAMQFGEKLVIDCSYDDHMTTREATNAAKQLMMCFAENRSHDEPFDLHFCSANFSGTTMHYFEKHVPTMHEPWFPLNVHVQCFTEMFPREKLVYLTPHCRNDLLKFNPDDIYIIGAMVDKVNNEPLSLAKAKKMGLRMARLPLDQYLMWGAGSGKSLTINQMVSIMLDLKKTGDWKYSLRHVPTRKIISSPELNREKLKSTLYKYKFDIDTWGKKKTSKRN